MDVDGKRPGLRPKQDPAPALPALPALPSLPDLPHFEESDCPIDSFCHFDSVRLSQARAVVTAAGLGSDEVGRFAAHPALVSRCGVVARKFMEEMLHDAIECNRDQSNKIKLTRFVHCAFLHPSRVKILPALGASPFRCCDCGRCRYEVCDFSISSRATCSCWSVCRGIAVSTQRATAMVGGRFVMTDRVSWVSQAETDNKLYKPINLTCFSR